MTKNRFKQVCNYFYDLKNGCSGKMFESDNVDDVINIFNEYYNKLVGAYTISFMLTDYEYERSKLLDVYKECLHIMRFKQLLRINMINDDGKDVFIYEKN